MRTYRQANPIAMQRFDSLTDRSAPLLMADFARFHDGEMPGIFSGLENEQQAFNDAMGQAFKRHDYGAIYDTLEFLKFSRFNVESLVDLAATAAGFMSGVGSIVAAVQTITKVLEFMGATQSADFDIQQRLISIGEQVNALYVHEVIKNQQETKNRAVDIRTKLQDITAAMHSVQTTGLSAATIEDLGDAIDLLDDTLGKMLPPEKGLVFFSRGTYAPSIQWLHYFGSPFLKRADGSTLPRLEELKTMVWDPGFYLDALAVALRLRIATGTTLEPLFRSTGHRLPKVIGLVPQLRTFIDEWRRQILVAQPWDCLLPDGTLAIYDQFGPYGNGIMIGAMCPVTGISSLRMFTGFASTHTTTTTGWGFGGKGKRTMKAVDPKAALHDAVIQHQTAVLRLNQVCGLREFEELYQHLAALARPPHPSESVHFEAVRRLHVPAEFAAVAPVPTTIDLGDLRQWATDPSKTYQATRHFTTGCKEVVLRLGRRARTSEVRLGYKLLIADKVYEITAYETAPPDSGGDWFPAQPFDDRLTLPMKVYDCIQSRGMSAVEEEAFDENGDAGSAQRLLLNERETTVNVRIRVEFSAFVDGDHRSHLGEVRITFVPDEVTLQPHAYVLSVDVLETHVASTAPDFAVEEVRVEGLSLHIIPSWLKVGPEFFDDHQDAIERMWQVMLKKKLPLEQALTLAGVPTFVDPSPKYATVREAAQVQLATKAFAIAARDPGFLADLQRFQVPRSRDR